MHLSKFLIIFSLPVLHSIQLALYLYELSQHFPNSCYHGLLFIRLFCRFYQDRIHCRGSFLFHFGQLLIHCVKNCFHCLLWLQPNILHFLVQCKYFIIHNSSLANIPKLLQRPNLIFQHYKFFVSFCKQRRLLMWGVAPHRIDAHTGDVQETRRHHYNTSQQQYNHDNVNVSVINCTNSPERSHNNQNKQNTQWHDRCSPHSVPYGPTSVSTMIPSPLQPRVWSILLQAPLIAEWSRFLLLQRVRTRDVPRKER